MSQSQAVTIVISRDGRTAGGDHADFENALADALNRAHGADVLLVPHLYHLRAPHSAAAALMNTAGDLVVASWLHPRAAFWTLRALGVGTRVIRCLNLADFASVADCAQALAPAKPSAGPAAKVQEITDPADPRWYPIIDYSRCTGCRKCMDFCLFGVYALSEDHSLPHNSHISHPSHSPAVSVAVSNPDNCKNGCPACARTCPQRAIIFPHYFADAAIAGAETQSSAPDGQASVENAPPAHAPKPKRSQDDLDHLITALEKLDE